MSSISKRILFWVVALILSFLLAAAVVYSQDMGGPQVILVVNRTTQGKILVIPQSQVYFALIPAPETHPAPLSDGAYMICRQITVHDEGGPHVEFKCGMDRYRLQGLGISENGQKLIREKK